MPFCPEVFANMVKEVFDQKNIPCYVHVTGIAEGFQIEGTSLAGASARLYVPEDRVEECSKIQQEMIESK